MTGGARSAGRVGFTLLETLIALLLGWLVASLALTTLARQRDAQVRVSRRGESLAATRAARHVLTRELRVLGPGEMAWRLPADSLNVRAYRGVALVCPGHLAAGKISVAWEGLRAPEAAKDSVWVLGDRGEESVLGLSETLPRAVPCGAPSGASGATWVLSGPPPAHPVLALYFERGAFHLSDRALRYRRGDGGRQPVTPESFLTPPSSFERWGDGVAARLAPADALGRIESVVGPAYQMGRHDGG